MTSEDGEWFWLPLCSPSGLRAGILSRGSDHSREALFGCIACCHFPQPSVLESNGQGFCRLSLGRDAAGWCEPGASAVISQHAQQGNG